MREREGGRGGRSREGRRVERKEEGGWGEGEQKEGEGDGRVGGAWKEGKGARQNPGHVFTWQGYSLACPQLYCQDLHL